MKRQWRSLVAVRGVLHIDLPFATPQPTRVQMERAVAVLVTKCASASSAEIAAQPELATRYARLLDHDSVTEVAYMR
ncbi:hypothetical protein Pcac1_g11440 [Phytophthora cactorum]|nr:hypothetical protein Pcac1_g11440 [Phytophthora cactorum]